MTAILTTSVSGSMERQMEEFAKGSTADARDALGEFVHFADLLLARDPASNSEYRLSHGGFTVEAGNYWKRKV